ncbi:11281_t:CDS:2, partial [Gigaspora rosea]
DHNHSPQASSAEVDKSIAHIKEQAKETNDQPTSSTDMPAQPQNLDDINIPNSLCSALNGENFLVRDSIIGKDRILLFTTKANIQHLSRALYWIMDGTFKDFELAAISASHDEFPDVHNKECFFHLGQTFLPSNEIPVAFDVLKEKMLPETNESRTTSFSTTNVVWSVHDSMEIGVPRTSNIVEAWHRHWKNLVGLSHVGVYTIVTEFQKEQQQVEYQTEAIFHGTQRLKPKNVILSKSPIPVKNKYKKGKKVQITILVKNKHEKRKKVQITIPGEAQIQERRESPNHHSQQRAYERKKLKHKKRKKVRIAKPDEEQTQERKESPNYQTRRRTNKERREKQIQKRRESLNHHSGEKQTQERKE